MGLVGWKDVGLKFRLWVDFYNGRRIMVFPNHNNIWLLLCASSCITSNPETAVQLSRQRVETFNIFFERDCNDFHLMLSSSIRI